MHNNIKRWPNRAKSNPVTANTHERCGLYIIRPRPCLLQVLLTERRTERRRSAMSHWLSKRTLTTGLNSSNDASSPRRPVQQYVMMKILLQLPGAATLQLPPTPGLPQSCLRLSSILGIVRDSSLCNPRDCVRDGRRRSAA
ncbi:hypothetical protein BaRGS_00014825 [Batillaria attramentaria]|uniref:Uncharacterized protein n=1 Tax=Batillaria attramentaria TaxID=370345 RepID=A0ABD0L330_9CAEN